MALPAGRSEITNENAGRFRRRRPSRMQQVTFSDQAMQELNKLDLYAQLQAIHPISSLKAAELAHPREPLGH